MNKLTKTAVAAVAALALTAGVANAGPKKWGPAVGVGIGLGIIGGIIASEAAYAGGYRQCQWVAQYNGYGDYVGSRKVCYID